MTQLSCALGLLLADGAHSGEEEDFLARRPSFFFTKTAITRERKVEKSLPIWEMNLLSEGYQRAVDQNWGHMANIGFLGQKPRFQAQKKAFTSLMETMFGPRPEKIVQRKKLPFPK